MKALRVGAFNHENGGNDGPGDWARLTEQAEMIAPLGLDVLFSTEGKGWLDNGREALWILGRRLGMYPSVARADRHGCHLVIWTNPSTVCIRRERHQEVHPWWHALGVVEVDIPGVDGPVCLVACHLSPFDPVNRLGEARALSDYARRISIMGGDFNDHGIGDRLPDLSRLAPVQKLHRDTSNGTAAEILDCAGFCDVAAEVYPDAGDRKPTAGHDDAATRCDRMYLSPDALEWLRPVDYEVTQPPPNLSDHSLVTAVLEVIQ